MDPRSPVLGLVGMVVQTLRLRWAGWQGSSDGKESACNAEDLGLIPVSGRSSGEGNGYPLLYSCLENSTEKPGGLQSVGLQGVRHN